MSVLLLNCISKHGKSQPSSPRAVDNRVHSEIVGGNAPGILMGRVGRPLVCKFSRNSYHLVEKTKRQRHALGGIKEMPEIESLEPPSLNVSLEGMQAHV